MSRKIKYCIVFLMMLALSGCFGLFDSNSDRITGKYIVLWIDFPENQVISEEIETHGSSSLTIVPEYIFGVGHNDKYIIAKQHPTAGFDSGFKINTKITNYYIIDITRRQQRRNDYLSGPLSAAAFAKTRHKLHIDDIEFDMTYPDEP